jgi:CARDB
MSSRAQIAAATLTAALAALVAISTGGGAAAQQPAARPAPGEAAVQLLECRHDKATGDRWAVFRGEMKQIPAATGMRMRFDLSERVGRDAWRGVKPYAVGDWHAAKPGVTRFAYRQRVAGLKPGTRYRATVAFQWLDDAGGVVTFRRLPSPVCRQTGRLPNLAFRGDAQTRPGPTAETAHYKVRIVNDGRAPAGRSALQLSVDGADVDSRPTGKLAAGERAVVRFVGPVCADRIRVRLDPDDVVREVTERDNLRVTRC